MAEQVMIDVRFEGQSFSVPQELLSADQRDNTRLVQQYIREEIEETKYRAEQRKAKKDKSIESEFKTIQAKLKEVDNIQATLEQQSQTIASYAAANQALKAQVAALEESGEGLGNASSNARQTSFDLSNAATSGAAVLAQMQSENRRLSDTVEAMRVQLDELQLQFADQSSKALEAGKTMQRLQQEASNRALEKAYDAEKIARKAEAVAAKSERDAEAAPQRVSCGCTSSRG